MRSCAFLAFLVAIYVTSNAQEIYVKGTVTYLSAGTIYTSIGAEIGAQDSAKLFVVANTDTIATLKIFAVSSKTSACNVLSQKRPVIVGDQVIGSFSRPVRQTSQVAENPDTTDAKEIRGTQPLGPRTSQKTNSLVDVRGRVSLQYYTTQFDNNSFNFTQPGMVLDLHARSSEIPLRLDMYGNLRTLARGSTSPFSSNVEDASRIYQLSISYNDKVNDLTIGRIIPVYSPSIGSIDGVSYSHTFGNFLSGISFGFQPPYTLQGISTDSKKMALFAQYQTHSSLDLSVTGAYARTYAQSSLDREAVSFMVTGFTAGGFSVYGYTDIDLRMKEGDQFRLSPSISLGSATLNYRLTNFLTLGLGADASRAVFPFSTVRSIPDSLLDRTLRSGASVSLNVTLMNGVNLFNTYSPRSAAGGFGSDYLNNSAIFLNNVLSSGATIRAMYTMNENEFTSSRVYGVNVERTFFGISLSFRYQQNQYRLLQLNQNNTGQTLGGDLMALISSHLSFITSVDAMRGFGANSYSVFSELSWRF